MHYLPPKVGSNHPVNWELAVLDENWSGQVQPSLASGVQVDVFKEPIMGRKI